jgi:carbon monoxide dehydrogenase subunit G
VNFEQRCTVAVDRDRLWDFLVKVPDMAGCVPGASGLTAKHDGVDEQYTGQLRVKVGPIGLGLQGVMTVREKNRHEWRIVSRVEATDRRVGGGVFLNVSMTLGESGSNETELRIVSEARLMGKLGEFGQAVIRRKADRLVAEFAKNVAARFGS